MKYIREEEAPGEIVGPPHARVLKHLAAPWTLGTQNLWLGTSTVEPGNTSNPHSHADLEEVFYCVSGRGRVRVDDEEVLFEPGTTVYIPVNSVHQLINDGDEPLKVVCVTSPPFIPEQFRKDHDLE